MRHKTRTYAALAVLALLGAAAAVGACGGVTGAQSPSSPSVTPPTGPADITGVIDALQPGSASCAVSLLVVADPDAGGGYDRAQVAVVGASTVWASGDDGATRLTVDDLAEGQRVAVWFAGPVAESYPVQAKAQSVQILTPLD